MLRLNVPPCQVLILARSHAAPPPPKRAGKQRERKWTNNTNQADHSDLMLLLILPPVKHLEKKTTNHATKCEKEANAVGPQCLRLLLLISLLLLLLQLLLLLLLQQLNACRTNRLPHVKVRRTREPSLSESSYPSAAKQDRMTRAPRRRRQIKIARLKNASPHTA